MSIGTLRIFQTSKFLFIYSKALRKPKNTFKLRNRYKITPKLIRRLLSLDISFHPKREAERPFVRTRLSSKFLLYFMMS